MFIKASYNDMYLKRIDEDPKRLTLIIWVQSVFRRRQARKIMLLKLIKRDLADPKNAKSVSIIRRFVYRWRFRQSAMKLIAERRSKQDPKYLKAVGTIQRWIRRWKFKNVAKKLMMRRSSTNSLMAWTPDERRLRAAK